MKYTPFFLLPAVLFSLPLNAQIKPPELDYIRYMTDPAADKVIGSGDAVEVERYFETGYDEIVVGNGMQLFVLPGAGNTLKLVAQRQILPLVSTTTSERTLTIRLTASLETTMGIRLYVPAGQLSKITLKEGAFLHLPGTVAIDSLALLVQSGSWADCELVSKQFSCTVMGGSTMHLSGKAALTADLAVLGGSSLKGKKFDCARCKITVLGASDAKIRVSEALNARVENESMLVFYGNPVNKTINTALNGKIRHGFGL